jgi:hypothetical protein
MKNSDIVFEVNFHLFKVRLTELQLQLERREKIDT